MPLNWELFEDRDLTGVVIALLASDRELRTRTLNMLTGMRVEFGGTGMPDETFRTASGIAMCQVLSAYLHDTWGIQTGRPENPLDGLARAALDATNWDRVGEEMLAEADREARS